MQKDHEENVKQPDFIEPVTTLRDEGNLIHIVTKLPGIAEEKIRIDIDLEKTTITIVAADTTKMYKKIITLPGNVVFSNKRYSDGELHLIVEKKGSWYPLPAVNIPVTFLEDGIIVSKFASKSVFCEIYYYVPG